MAIKALEEIQQYREIGTIENLKLWISLFGLDGFDELAAYKRIGTVEECRAAVERQKPVRVEYEGSKSGDGFCGYRMAKCPKCGEWRRDRDKDDNIYCSKCGSKLDWSEEE